MSKAQDKAYKFLTEHRLAVVSTVSAETKPWGTAVYYVVDEKLHFYFLVHTESKKYDNIHLQPTAAITVADDDAQTTVQAVGKVTVVKIGQEHDSVFRMLATIHPPGQYSWVPPVSKLHNGKTALLRLAPESMRLSVFHPKRTTPDIYKIK